MKKYVLKNITILLKKIAISRIPGLINICSFSFPLSEEDKSSSSEEEESSAETRQKEKKCDVTCYITFSEHNVDNNVSKIITKYLNSEKGVDDKMNPTIRSKIIFGVAAIMKRLHKMNVIHRDLKL
ncbi:hypothetical protein M9Y10_007514 [Tritrichomonas musculus]|uniref:Protein kinase domain-containing protein n=1 Tax=Tritrichomonas musculus TaxID=1915356 RepID=A0ABR2J1J6_9EUKA